MPRAEGESTGENILFLARNVERKNKSLFRLPLLVGGGKDIRDEDPATSRAVINKE